MAKAKRYKQKARRAKKSEMPKKLLIVPGLLIGMSASALGISSNINTRNIGSIGTEVDMYNASDFVKDVFTKSDTKYLPIKYDDPYEQISRADIEREFNAAGMRIESISSDTIGTGTEIKTANATYTVLIYGDVDGNGQVNVRDVQCIVKHLLYGNGSELKGINRIAANVDNEQEDKINVRDAQRIVQFIVGKNDIIDSMPTSDIHNDKEAPVITLNGEQETTVRVFEEYKDSGVTITDNLDPNVQNRLEVTTNINTNIPGDYVYIYNVKDASGNKAQTVTRTVHVVDYVKDIKISSNPKVEYVDGEEITLENMTAYAVYAYAGTQKMPIDINEIEFTPKKAELGMTEIKFKYQGVEKTIPINVTEQLPIITLTGHNGATDLKVKVGTTYDEGATAWDEIDNKELKVTWEIVEGTSDTSIPGKFVVKYTTEPNSRGKIGTLTRTVEVVDYITSVTFEVDDTEFKSVYVDGEEISLKGIKAYGIYAYKGKTEIKEELECDTTKVEYDRNKLANNKAKEIVVSYTVYDEIDKKSYTYKSSDIDDTRIKIDVIKPFETIVEESNIPGTSSEGELYSDIFVARVKAGSDEEKIKADKVKCIINSEEPDEDGYKPYAWAEDAEDGYVDIHFIGVANRTYRITVMPKETTNYTKSINFDVELEPNTDISQIEIGEFKSEAGAIRLKAGDSAIADVNFYHTYTNKDGEHKKKIDLPQNRVDSIEVKTGNNTDTTEVRGETVIENGYVKKVRIKSTENATTSNNGEEFKVSVLGKNGQTLKRSEVATVKIYAASNYEVQLGTNYTTNSEQITLSLRDYNNSNFEIREYNGNYYTLIPIRQIDQYDELKSIKYNDLSTSKDDISKGKIVFDDNKDTSTKSYIDVIGITSSYKQAENDNDIVTKVGIAIKDADSSVNEEDELRNGTISVYYKNEILPVKLLNNINVIKKAISSITYDTSNTTGIKNSAECFESATIAKVKSGAKQENLTSANEKSIGFKVIKKGATQVQDSNVSDSNDIHFNKFTRNGVTEIEFTADYPGTYEITPYIVINGKQVIVEGGKATRVVISENTTVNKIRFADTASESDNGSESFGTAQINTKERKYVKFYHRYDNGVERQVKDVENQEIIITNSNSNLKIDKMYGGMVIGEETGLDNAIVDELRIVANEKCTVGSNLTFSIAVKRKGQTTAEYSQNVTVRIAAKLEIDRLKVGNNSNVTLYNSAPGSTVTDVKAITENGKTRYYTLVPITFLSSASTGSKEVYSSDLNMDNVSTSKLDKDVPGKIVFRDNISENPLLKQVAIQLKGFVKNGTEYEEAIGTKPIEYIGIAISDNGKWYLDETDPDDPDYEQFKKITVFYKKSASSATQQISLTVNY